ncbi:hypothetical protein BH23CHL5_BH23CHL5_06260 [soil metagenome]
MTEQNLLDALLAAILVTIGVIGYWRGVARSLIVLAGALIGSELALWWSNDVGDRFSSALPLADETGRFVAATGIIVLATLMLGVGCGSAFSTSAARRRDRAGGVLISSAAGTLVVALVIRFFYIHMESRATGALGDTRLASLLWEQFDLLIALIAMLVAAVLVVNWILGEEVDDEDSVLSLGSFQDKSRQKRAATSAASARVPDRGFTSAPGRSQQTDGLKRESGSYSDVENDSDPFAAFRQAGSESLKQHSPAGPASALSSGNVTSSARVADAAEFPDVASDHEPDALLLRDEDGETSQEGGGICPNCGMLLKHGDQYCSDCGYATD